MGAFSAASKELRRNVQASGRFVGSPTPASKLGRDGVNRFKTLGDWKETKQCYQVVVASHYITQTGVVGGRAEESGA